MVVVCELFQGADGGDHGFAYAYAYPCAYAYAYAAAIAAREGRR